MQLAPLIERINHYEKLMRLDRPIGTLLLLWPTLWALWIAGKGSPSLINIVIFVLGVVLVLAGVGALKQPVLPETREKLRRTLSALSS